MSGSGDNLEIMEDDAHPQLEPSPVPNGRRLKDYIRVTIPSLETGLLDQGSRPTRLLDFLRARPSLEWLKGPFSVFQRTIDERDEASRSIPSPAGIRRRFHIRFLRKISWVSLRKMCKEWLTHPMNIALLIWSVFVACFLSLLFLLMTGLVDQAFPTDSSRNRWIEICNQVLNMLFTLMSLYQHPDLSHQLVMLCRWNSEDIIALRKVYCKNGARRPHEWTHMVVVVVLLHIACFAQYALCGLYWAYTSEERPEFSDDLCEIVGIIAPVLAGVYTVYSPLGREYDLDSDEESQRRAPDADTTEPTEQGKTGLKLYYNKRVEVSRPEWVGGLFDCGDDLAVAYLSFFCTCCVFGWNMERLGFGNMYVHIATFLLLCIAPFWVFGISALNIHNFVIREVVSITGMVLCLFGLLYGGFWRIQIRRRFDLPGNALCCGSRSMTDYIQWMFCWSCSLAQEVRTGNFYDVEDDGLYRKHMDDDSVNQYMVNSCENDSSPLINSECSMQLPVSWSPGSPSGSLTPVRESSDEAMVAPVQQLIVLEFNGADGNQVILQSSDSFTTEAERGDSEPVSEQIQDK